MKWIKPQSRLPSTTDDVYRSACSYKSAERVSAQILIFCNGDDQYRTGWYLESVEDGNFFEIDGVGDCNIDGVTAWMPITELTTESLAK